MPEKTVTTTKGGKKMSHMIIGIAAFVLCIFAANECLNFAAKPFTEKKYHVVYFFQGGMGSITLTMKDLPHNLKYASDYILKDVQKKLPQVEKISIGTWKEIDE